MKLKKIFAFMSLAIALFSACSDEPDSQYLYTFTGEMMSQYLENRPEFSLFSEAVKRAGLDKQLSAYGHYTCFAPNDSAVNRWLKGKGLASLEELSDKEKRTACKSVVYSGLPCLSLSQ